MALVIEQCADDMSHVLESAIGLNQILEGMSMGFGVIFDDGIPIHGSDDV